ELEGDDAPRCLFRGGSLAALEAQLSALRGRLARVRIRIQGCPTELVLFDSQEDSHSAQAAPQTSAPWLSGLAPGVDQWSQLLASIRSLRRTVRRLELLSTLARGSRQVIYSIEDPDADFESALAGLDNARPIVEEVRLFLLGQEQELVLFRREEDEAVALLPGGAAGPEPEEADEWASALASLAQLQPVLREVWVTAGGGSAEPWLTTKGFAATLSALRSRPVSRLAVELAGASQAVVLYEPEGTSSGEGPVQSEAASWEDLPATLEDLEPVLEALVLHHSDGTRRELRGQLGATGLWEQARAARARGLERVEAELLGLGSRLLYRAPTHEQLSLRQLRAAMIRAQPPLVAELHLPPGQQVPLPPDPASAVAALEDLFPVLASVRDASGALVFEQAATERHLLEPPAEEAFPALPGQATIDLSGDPDFARLSTALSNVISTAEAVIATLAEGDEHRLSPGTAESVLAQRWEEVRAVAVVLPGLETPLVLLQRAAPSRDDRRWREVSKALERLGSQVKSLLVELREGEPARWHSEGGYAYERFLKGLQAHRANVKRVLVRLRGSPHDLVLFSLEESPSGALKRRDAGHATSAVWDPMREAISHMEPLIEAVEARLSNQAEVYQPIYLDGGDLEAALSRLDGMRQRLESIRVRFQPICLFQRYRPSDSVLLEPPR
ncbi:MAG TPA: hypothetical protein DEA08_08700, partial [Planctomycetes bacterium]|nr:hypothetical protein [Planctomycetota bacterium]